MIHAFNDSNFNDFTCSRCSAFDFLSYRSRENAIHWLPFRPPTLTTVRINFHVTFGDKTSRSCCTSVAAAKLAPSRSTIDWLWLSAGCAAWSPAASELRWHLFIAINRNWFCKRCCTWLVYAIYTDIFRFVVAVIYVITTQYTDRRPSVTNNLKGLALRWLQLLIYWFTPVCYCSISLEAVNEWNKIV